MRTEPLYALDSSIKEFDTTVLAVQGHEVALGHTAFYPGGVGSLPIPGPSQPAIIPGR